MNAGNFNAIDFETARGNRNSICQVGIVVVQNYEIVERFSMLIKPPHNNYSDNNISIHGIGPLDTEHSPTFDKAWDTLREYIEDQHMVAHNVAFDKDCLFKALEYYRMPIPDMSWQCTYKIFGSGLERACTKYGIELFHHDALSDAEAAAKLMLIHLTR